MVAGPSILESEEYAELLALAIAGALDADGERVARRVMERDLWCVRLLMDNAALNERGRIRWGRRRVNANVLPRLLWLWRGCTARRLIRPIFVGSIAVSLQDVFGSTAAAVTGAVP